MVSSVNLRDAVAVIPSVQTARDLSKLN